MSKVVPATESLRHPQTEPVSSDPAACGTLGKHQGSNFPGEEGGPRGGGWRASRGPWAGVPGPPWGAPEFPPPQPGSRPLCAASALGARGASVPRWRSARSPGAASARGRVGADAAPTAREGGRGDGTSGTLHVSDGLVRGRPPWAALLPPPPSLADGPGPRREACPTGRSRQLICFHTWKLLRKPQN